MFRKLAVLLLAIFGWASVFSASSLAQNTSNIRINSFGADFYLSRNEAKTSLLTVEETIVAEFPNFDQNHGILRAIPKTYQDHTVSLKIKSVTDENGNRHNYSTYNENDNLVLKIGDADKFVHGNVTYKINYELKNVINFQTLDEFYWDINGDEWSQVFENVEARVHIPEELANELTADQACYTGGFGGTLSSCVITRKSGQDETVIEVSATRSLNPGETLTLVTGFKQGTFELGPEIAAEERRKKIIAALISISIGVPLLGSIWFVVSRYRKYGKDPKGRGVIVPEYLPPKDFTTIKSETILKETVTPKAVSAAIIELAVKHYIVIYEIKKKKILKDTTEFELELIRDPSDLPRELAEVVDALFPDGAIVGAKTKLNALKNKLYSTLPKLNDQTLHGLFIDGYFRSDPKKIKNTYIKTGVIMMVVAVAVAFLVLTIPFAIGLFIGGLIVLISASSMPSKSLQGVGMQEYLKGLEQYMKLAEAERINFSQGLETAERVKANPETEAEKIKLFEKLLPYAMLFGIEKSWSKQFADLYKQPPEWYRGNIGTFNAAYLAGSLSSFGSMSTAAFTSPSSSGSSGFGGGGFSGGGGGGGGGGGW